MEAQRALLDELMGKQRDVPEAQRRLIKFDDPDIDKLWLVGLQPFDMFRNTPWASRVPEIYRRAVGREWTAGDQPRDVIEQWNKVPAKAQEKYGYEWTLYVFLEELVRCSDRTVQKARQAHESKAGDVDAAKLRDLDAQIAQVTKEASIGESDVDRSLSMMARAEELRLAKDALLRPQVQKVLVCEVSGNVVQNTQVRIQEHYAGRIYLSWKAVRDKLAELKEKYNYKPPPRPIPRYDWRKDPEFFPRRRRRSPSPPRRSYRRG